MQQDEQTALDIFQRNTHSNIFRIKIPSHNASKQKLDMMAHAFVLSKLALLPFYQNERLAQLFKASLEFLINSDKQRYKSRSFVEGIVAHAVWWQINMSIFGSWPYTRACFYSIEEKLKHNQDDLQRVILQRGILQPNKQQFMNKSQNMNFKSSQLKFLTKLCNKQDEASSQKPIQLPNDILFLDSDECWTKLKEELNNGNLSKDQLQDCLLEYDQSYVFRYLCKNMKAGNVQQSLISLKMRQQVFLLVLKKEGTNISKAVKVLQQKLKVM